MKDTEMRGVLLLSSKKYSQILEHMDRKEKEKRVFDEEAAYKRRMKEQSSAMEKNWPDSIKNIKKREQERRDMKNKLQLEERNTQMEYYKEFHREERKKYLADVREKMMMKRQPNSTLSNALVESYIRAENAANLKLKKEIQREENEREAKYVEHIFEDVENFKKSEEQKKCEAVAKTKVVKAFQLKQIEEKQKNYLQYKTQRLEKERDDLRRMGEEIEEKKYKELEDQKYRKMKMKKYMQSQLQKKEREKVTSITEDKELLEVCGIFNDFHRKRACRIKKQRKQELKELTDFKQKLGVQNKVVGDNIEEKQNEILRKQQEELEERYQLAQKEKTEHKKEIQNERFKYYSEMNIKKGKKRTEEKEMLRYEMAERFKFAEKEKHYETEKNKGVRDAEVEFMKEWGKQIEEKKELMLKKAPKKIMKDFYEIEDEKFFLYAQDVLEYARKRGWEDQPIIREINEYCKKNQIPMYPECMKKFPSSTSRPSDIKLPKILRKNCQ